MIARHEAHLDKTDVWSALAAPLPAEAVAWRQDGRPVERDGGWYARFVAYVDANTVRERLDRVVPGEWDLTLDLLPPLPVRPNVPDDDAPQCAFKARLQVLGVIREDVGTGRDYKAAATDAFKRAAVRFGIAHELYALEPNWVQVDGDTRWAKPLEAPHAAYRQRGGTRWPARSVAVVDPAISDTPVTVEPERDAQVAGTSGAPEHDGAELPNCPKCNGTMWDNRLTKRNPKAPDYKCRDRSCDGAIWPPRPAGASGQGDGITPATAPTKRTSQREVAPASQLDGARDASPLGAGALDDDLPF